MTSFTIDGKTGKASIIKDPNAVLDYTFDWTDWLDDIPDTILSAAVVIDSQAEGGDATVNSISIVGLKAVVAWVQGGTVNTKVALRCRITTNGARIEDRTVYLNIKER